MFNGGYLMLVFASQDTSGKVRDTRTLLIIVGRNALHHCA